MEAPQQSPYDEALASKESRIKRFKPIWRLLLISNLALGAYMFAKARKKHMSTEDSRTAKKGVEDVKASAEASLDPTTIEEILEKQSPPPAVVKPKEPIPEDQQQELFKWILEEKRKIKPKGPEEKKRIDEEKAILKQFIRAKSTPNL